MQNVREKINNIQWNEYVIYIIFVIIFTFFSITLRNKGFLTVYNLTNIIRQSVMIAIMAVGMTYVLAAEEIDLSFSSIVSISAIVSAMLLRSTGSVILSPLGGLGVGVLIGFFNGFLVTKFRVPSFLVTLGMGTIVLGISRWISGLQSIPVNNDLYTFVFGSGDIGPIPVLLIWVLLVMFIGHYALKNTPFGKRLLATGSDQKTASYMGISVSRIKVIALTINGFLASLAGILYSGRLHGARYTLGQDDLMVVIAATIIGGTSMFGGKGSVIGAVFGALVMAMLRNGLVLYGFSVDQQMIFRGSIIIIAVILTMRKSFDL